MKSKIKKYLMQEVYITIIAIVIFVLGMCWTFFMIKLEPVLMNNSFYNKEIFEEISFFLISAPIIMIAFGVIAPIFMRLMFMIPPKEFFEQNNYFDTWLFQLLKARSFRGDENDG